VALQKASNKKASSSKPGGLGLAARCAGSGCSGFSGEKGWLATLTGGGAGTDYGVALAAPSEPAPLTPLSWLNHGWRSLSRFP
jgi:hypothetical protein